MITSVALYVFKALYNRLLILGCVRWQLGEPACSPRLLGSASPEEQVPRLTPAQGPHSPSCIWYSSGQAIVQSAIPSVSPLFW